MADEEVKPVKKRATKKVKVEKPLPLHELNRIAVAQAEALRKKSQGK